jgi:hypothetical protein
MNARGENAAAWHFEPDRLASTKDALVSALVSVLSLEFLELFL